MIEHKYIETESGSEVKASREEETIFIEVDGNIASLTIEESRWLRDRLNELMEGNDNG